MNILNNSDELTLREKIRVVWRPLYDLGINGQDQVDGQYMAMLASQATTEIEQLITEAKISELELLIQTSAMGAHAEAVLAKRISELKALNQAKGDK